MSVQATAPPYPQLLRRAYALGLADGRFARRLEVAGGHQVGGDLARGRTPRQFAAWLWRGRTGQPPAGLEVNTPLWYAAGFADGLSGGPPRRPAPDVQAIRGPGPGRRLRGPPRECHPGASSRTPRLPEGFG